jgi:mycofactocin precursor
MTRARSGCYDCPMDPATQAAPEADERNDDELVEDELLVEEISIDGMCGVY